MTNTSPGVRRWLGKGIWALADRGLFAASSVAINIALARWLSPDDYGAFTLAFTLFLLVGTAHTALLTDPMLVYGSFAYAGQLPDYLRVLLKVHWIFGLAAGLILLIAALVLALAGQAVLAVTLASVAVASPFILLQWLLRQACYMRLEPRRAAYAAGAYLVLVIVGTAILYDVNWLSAASAMILMGIASLGSAAGIVLSLGRERTSDEPQLARDVVAAHWSYFRWAAGSNALAWIPQSIGYLFLSASGGLAAAAALRALVNLILPVQRAYTALSDIIVPALVRARGGAAFAHIVRLVLCLWVAGSIAYWLFLGLFHRPLIHSLYHGRYDDHAVLLWIFGIVPVIGAGESICHSVLRARERPDQIFWASTLVSIAALTVGTALILRWGVVGAAIAMVCSSLTNVGAMAWQAWTHRTADYVPRRPAFDSSSA